MLEVCIGSLCLNFIFIWLFATVIQKRNAAIALQGVMGERDEAKAKIEAKNIPDAELESNIRDLLSSKKS